MTKQSDSPLSFTAGETIGAYLRVKLAGRTAYLAGASEFGVGVCQQAQSSGQFVCIQPYEHGGTMKMTASGVIAAGKNVFAAASGKIAATGTKRIGTALEGATADGSVIEVAPHIGYQQSSSSSSSSSSSAGS